MARIPATTFRMGTIQGETDEQPPHDVQLGAFLLDRTEVTNADYAVCVDANVCTASQSAADPHLNGARHPVVGITWTDANHYCEWVGKRLPTEAEFERAIRGSTNRPYAFEGKWDNKRANVRGTEDGHEFTAPVGSYPMGMSKEGPVLDLNGNAAEWCSDWYDPVYYASQEEWADPKGPSLLSGDKVVRGGSYSDPEYAVRASARGRMQKNLASSTIGFRCAANP